MLMNHMPPDAMAVHGFLVVGTSTLFFSHLPAYMAPHTYQVLMEVELAAESAGVLEIYKKDLETSGSTVYTFQPQSFTLPTLVAHPPLKELKGTLFRGNFFTGKGVSIAPDVTVRVTRVVYFRKFTASPPPDAGPLRHVVFGKGDEHFMAHFISTPPNFDQILKIDLSRNPLSDAELQHTVEFAVPDRSNTEATRLTAGKVSGMFSHNEGNPTKAELTVVAELFELSDFLKAAPMPTADSGTHPGMVATTAHESKIFEAEVPVAPVATDFVTDFPVQGFNIKFSYRPGIWREIFDLHVELIQGDLIRALADDRCIVYLSCPISTRGGSHSITNVDIAKSTALRLGAQWGERFFFLDPAQYQMESKVGTGLIRDHIRALELKYQKTIDIDKLMKEAPPGGGDYMRMWTRVLVEDGTQNVGGRFSAFYFLGPSDTRAFFAQGGAQTDTAAVEQYFARKCATDGAFKTFFEGPFLDASGKPMTDDAARQQAASLRNAFFSYYTLKAGAAFSKGSHDEWNIWTLVNQARLTLSKDSSVGDLMPGFYDGRQIDMAAAVLPATRGYEPQ